MSAKQSRKKDGLSTQTFAWKHWWGEWLDLSNKKLLLICKKNTYLWEKIDFYIYDYIWQQYMRNMSTSYWWIGTDVWWWATPTNPKRLSHHLLCSWHFGNGKGSKRRCEASEPQAGQKSQPAQSADSQLIAVPSPDTAFTVFRLSTSTWGKSFFSFWPLNLVSDWTHSNISLFAVGRPDICRGWGWGWGDRGRGVSPSNWFSAQVFVESDFLIPLHHPLLEL